MTNLAVTIIVDCSMCNNTYSLPTYYIMYQVFWIFYGLMYLSLIWNIWHVGLTGNETVIQLAVRQTGDSIRWRWNLFQNTWRIINNIIELNRQINILWNGFLKHLTIIIQLIYHNNIIYIEWSSRYSNITNIKYVWT